MADSIAWIEETSGNKEQPPIAKSPPEESSTESNATIVETAVFKIDPPDDEVKPIGMNEYSNVNGHAGAHSDSQFDPFIHIPRGRWDVAGSTTSDPIPADDSESTSTVLTTATEDPKIYRETDKEREGIDDDEWKPLRSAQINKIRLEAEANQDYSPDAPKSSSKYSVDPNGSISVQLYTPSEWESQQQDTKESTPLATWQPTQTIQQQDGQPCAEITLNVTIKRIPKDSDEQIVEATNLNGQVKSSRERQSEKVEATGDKDDKTAFQRPGQEATTSVELPSQDLNKFAIDQQIQVQQFGHDVVAREDNKINEEKERQVFEDVKPPTQLDSQINQNDSQFQQNDSQFQQKDNFGTLACELQAKDTSAQQKDDFSNQVQQTQQLDQNSTPTDNSNQNSTSVQPTDNLNQNVHEVQFKSFSGEEYSQHELAPSISAIIMDHKEDRTLTASPKPEKRVNFSEQLVKRYPESPTDAKSFGADALLQKDEKVEQTRTGWQDVRPASAESNEIKPLDQGGEVRTTNFNLDVSIEKKPEEATKSETKPLDPTENQKAIQDVKNPDEIDYSFSTNLSTDTTRLDDEASKNDDKQIDVNFLSGLGKKPAEDQLSIDRDDNTSIDTNFSMDTIEKKPDEVNSGLSDLDQRNVIGEDKPIEVVSFEPSFEKKPDNEVNLAPEIDKLEFKSNNSNPEAIEVVSFEPSFEKKPEEVVSFEPSFEKKPEEVDKPVEVVSFEPSFEKKPEESNNFNNKQGESTSVLNDSSFLSGQDSNKQEEIEVVSFEPSFEKKPEESTSVLNDSNKQEEVASFEKKADNEVVQDAKEDTRSIESKFDAIRPDDLLKIDSKEPIDILSPIVEEKMFEPKNNTDVELPVKKEDGLIDVPPSGEETTANELTRSAESNDVPAKIEEEIKKDGEGDQKWIDVKDNEQKVFGSFKQLSSGNVEEQKVFDSTNADEQKVEEEKQVDSINVEEQKPFDSTNDNQKAEEQKPFDSFKQSSSDNVDEQKPSDQKVEEQKPFDSFKQSSFDNVDEQKPFDSVNSEQKIEEQKPSESTKQLDSNDNQKVEEQKPSDSNAEQQIQWTEQPAQQENQQQSTPSDGIQWIEQKTGGDQPTDSTLQVSTQPAFQSDVKTATPSPQAEPPNEEPNDRQKHESIVSWLLDKPKTDDAQWQAPGAEPKRVDSDAKSAESGGQEVKLDTQQKSTNEETPSTSVEKQSNDEKRVTGMEEVPAARRGSYEKDENRDVNAELDAYGQRLIQNTREALALVDALCQDTLDRQERRKRHLTGGPLDTLTNELSADQLHQKVTRPPITEFDDLEVEVYRVNPELMDEPKSCVLLPEAKLLILDAKMGLTLMDLPTKETKRCGLADDWRDVEHACYMKKHNQILLVYEQRVDDQNFQKYLARFDLQLQMLSKCEAPKYIQDKVVTTCRVCYVDETDCIYLAVNTPNDCFLYELTADCKWTEVYNMRNRQIADICKLATVGPVTELLVLDSNKRHILLLCIYNSALAERAMIAFCAEPAALTVDEHDNLIVFDRATNLVGIHSRLHFERIRDLVVVGRANCSLSAREGHLALLNQLKKELRICKY